MPGPLAEQNWAKKVCEPRHEGRLSEQYAVAARRNERGKWFEALDDESGAELLSKEGRHLGKNLMVLRGVAKGADLEHPNG